MPLILPSWIEASGLVGKKPSFKWGDDAFECEYEVPRLENDISTLYARAVLAFAAANAEWVVWPLSRGEDQLFADFIEASWAAVVDRRYLRHASEQYGDRIREHYRISPKAASVEDLYETGGLVEPVRGAQFVAIHILERIADLTAPDENGSMEAVYLCNLVDQVSAKNKVYRAWRKTVLGRLADHYALTEEGDFLGPPVPREALFERSYVPEQGLALLKAFLKGLDPKKNRFLTPAAEMTKLGFEGVPYEP